MDTWLRGFSGCSLVRTAVVPGMGCHATMMSLLQGRGQAGRARTFVHACT